MRWLILILTFEGQNTLLLDKECSKVRVQSSKISPGFILRPVVFELQTILRQVHWMTPKWPQTLQGQVYPIYVLPVYTSPKFDSVSLYDEPFSKYRPFWEKCTDYPQNDLEHKLKCTQYVFLVSLILKFISVTPNWHLTLQGHMCLINVLLVSTSHIFHSISLHDKSFSRYRLFWDQRTKLPQIDPEPYKVKLPYIRITSIPDS